MSVRVTAAEQPRVFEVKLGNRIIGRVTVHSNDWDKEPCRAEFFCPVSKEWVDLNPKWSRTIRQATRRIVCRAVGDGTVDEIIRRTAP